MITAKQEMVAQTTALAKLMLERMPERRFDEVYALAERDYKLFLLADLREFMRCPDPKYSGSPDYAEEVEATLNDFDANDDEM